jgi:hypothetical protein
MWMTKGRIYIWVLCAALSSGLATAKKADVAKEKICSDHKDNDQDSMVDCADADCFGDKACQPDGSDENTEAKCSDWIDNDNDGTIDCDDMDCQDAHIDACKGSWEKEQKSQPTPAAQVQPPKASASNDDAPEDLFGKGGDIDGERNYFMCTDGIDNDGDGRVDCADIGCQLDQDVGVCKGPSGFRFSVVGSVVPIQYDFEKKQVDTYFSRLQLRAFGSIPYIQNSFFLINARVEKDPRVSFALFQIPISKSHYFNINSGGGTLSNILIMSTAKQLLLDPAYKLYAPFESDSGVAAEVGGPITPDWKFTFRAFASGGSGRISSYIGGTKVSDPKDNYSFSVGAQAGMNVIGYYNRWDSPFIYAESPLTLAFALGAKYDQRNDERFPALDIQGVFRIKRFIALIENYWKREIDFGSWQVMYNLQLGFLLWPKHFLLAADVGQFLSTPYENLPSPVPSSLTKIRNYWQVRAALHWFFWRNIGIASLAYVHTDEAAGRLNNAARLIENTLRLEVQYRF